MLNFTFISEKNLNLNLILIKLFNKSQHYLNFKICATFSSGKNPQVIENQIPIPNSLQILKLFINYYK